ncbi:MAG: diguanylate cyclase [Thermoleophilia bacterium]
MSDICNMALEQTGDAVLSIEVKSLRVIEVNRWAAEITGLEPGQELIDGDPGDSDLCWLREIIAQAAHEKKMRLCKLWEPRAESSFGGALEVTVTCLDYEGKEIVIAIMRDVTRGKQVEEELWQRNQELKVLLRSGQMVARSLDPHEVIGFSLEAAMELLNAEAGKAYLADFDKEALTPVASKGLVSGAAPRTVGFGSHCDVSKAFHHRKLVFGRTGFDHPPSSEAEAPFMVAMPLLSENRVLGVVQVATSTDFIPEKRANLLASLGAQMGTALDKALHHLNVRTCADIDSLTGIFNRQRIEMHLQEEVRRAVRYGSNLALSVIDIDHFKGFNDAHNHLAGDRVLKEVARIIHEQLRSSDQLGRWGGEEFLVLLTETDPSDTETVIERIRQTIASTSFTGKGDAEVPLTVSCGFACYPADADTAADLIRSADDALLTAKRQGRNRIQRYAEDMSRQVLRAHDDHLFQDERLGTIKVLAAALDAKDSYTANHSREVQELALKIAKKMGIGSSRMVALKMAALVHDIGKVAVPDAILNKPGPLDKSEWTIIQEHPRMGMLILKEASHLTPILPVVLYHHERYDGLGYPEGRTGDAIPLLSRILCTADAYSAMTSSRSYRKAMEPGQAWHAIKQGRCRQFDPDVVDSMGEILELG